MNFAAATAASIMLLSFPTGAYAAVQHAPRHQMTTHYCTVRDWGNTAKDFSWMHGKWYICNPYPHHPGKYTWQVLPDQRQMAS